MKNHFSVCAFGLIISAALLFSALPLRAEASDLSHFIRHVFNNVNEDSAAAPVQAIPLTVSCIANPSQASVNYPVTFEPAASGGTGFYTYSWSGACISNSITCLRSFPQPGFYTAMLTVTSGPQSVSANCSANVSPNYNQNYGCGYDNYGYYYCGSERLDSNYPTTGDLYASSTTARVGEPFTITISGRDDNGLYDFRLNYKRSWHYEYFSDTNLTTTTRSWEISENSPGIYTYCGKVSGYKGASRYSSKDTVDTSPSCIQVNVQNSYQYNYQFCECASGPCCDGCHYKNSSTSCSFETQSEYACPWGTGCGSNVGKRTRTRLQYCSGDNNQCNGNFGSWLTWTDWTVADVCSASAACSSGSSQCQAKSSCSRPVLPISNPVPKAAVPVAVAEKPDSDRKPENKISSGLIVSFLAKKEKDANNWAEKMDVGATEKIDFLVNVTNSLSEQINDVVVRTELPEEIAYKENFKVEGESKAGQIKDGINIGPVAPNSTKTITFKGQVAASIKPGEKDIVTSANSGNLSGLDSVKMNFKFSQGIAAVGLAFFKFLMQKWYFWVLASLVLIFLFFVVFRKLFSVTPA